MRCCSSSIATRQKKSHPEVSWGTRLAISFTQQRAAYMNIQHGLCVGIAKRKRRLRCPAPDEHQSEVLERY